MNTPELLLTLYLLLLLPAHALWRGSRPKVERPAISIYWSNIVRLVLLLLALGLCALWSGYTAPQLGLAWPPGTAGMWGLAAAVLGLTGLHIGMRLHQRRMDDARRSAYQARLSAMQGMPGTRRELIVFAGLSVLLGAGWELLYRGFLLLVLPPVTGMAGAIVLSALSYGTGHGYHGAKQFIGSMVSAFVFTLGYAWTGSLWWLMAIHIYLPLSAGSSAYRVAAAKPGQARNQPA